MNLTEPTSSAPRVSIVMSCFNNESCVEKALHGIQRQSLTDWELVAVNDGSIDGTGPILDQAASSDPRIKVIHQANSGLTRALIRGCRTAKADVIARHDADDVSHPDRLRLQLELLLSDDAIGFVSSHAEFVGPRGEYLNTQSRPSDPETATRNLIEAGIGPPGHGTVMFRKSVYETAGGYRRQFYLGQDSDLWIRMAEISRIAYVQKVLYSVQIDSHGISGTGRDLQAKFGRLGWKCRDARLNGGDETPWLDEAEKLSQLVRAESVRRRSRRSGSEQRRSRRRTQAASSYFIGTQLIQNRDPRGREYLWAAVRTRPMHWKAWVRLIQSWGQSCLQSSRSPARERPECG